MTVANITQARDEMCAVIQTAWDATDAVTAGLPMLYPDKAQKTPSNGAYGRVTILHGGGGQATLSGETGARRFRHTGIVTVQVFTPIGDGLVLSDQIVQIVHDALAGTTTSPGRVHLRNVRVNEVGETGAWHQTNVLADFEYDEVR